MCRAMEDRLNEMAIQFAVKLLKLGTVSHEDIAKVTELKIEKIKELAVQINPETA